MVRSNVKDKDIGKMVLNLYHKYNLLKKKYLIDEKMNFNEFILLKRELINYMDQIQFVFKEKPQILDLDMKIKGFLEKTSRSLNNNNSSYSQHLYYSLQLFDDYFNIIKNNGEISNIYQNRLIFQNQGIYDHSPQKFDKINELIEKIVGGNEI